MKKAYYVTSFRKLTISDLITGHVELLPGVNITNDARIKRRLLTPEFAKAAGSIEMDFLQRTSTVVFGEFDADEMPGLTPEKFLLCIIIWIDGLFRNAWLIKDHAMECDAAFLRVAHSGRALWSSNFLAMRPSFADGDFLRNVDMSIAELKAWGVKNDLVDSYLVNTQSTSLRFMLEKGYARSGRAMQFIASARKTADVAFKLANYCSALETLFTTESTELAHKLSERVAFFLGERGYNRREVFASVKGAYGVRSKLVHGDTLKPKQIEDLPSLSTRCDDYLRSILNAIFASADLKRVFDTRDGAIEDYFARLIFGTFTSPTDIEAEDE